MNLIQTQDWTPVFIKSSNPSKVIPIKKEIIERKPQTTKPSELKLDANGLFLVSDCLRVVYHFWLDFKIECLWEDRSSSFPSSIY